MILTFPLMTAVQMISARIGRVTGQGLAGNLVRNYPAWLANSLVLLLLIANTINIGADLGAMADATALVTGLPAPVFLLAFAAFCATAEVVLRYEAYARILQMADAGVAQLRRHLVHGRTFRGTRLAQGLMLPARRVERRNT